MDAVIFNLSGNWGHFKKVDTNNNPLTHDFITKTALIGLIGAINGIERFEMKALFPQLSEDLVYSVSINSMVQKESWGFTLRSVKVNFEKSPWQFEFLKKPDFTIVLGLRNERSKAIFDTFCKNIELNKAYYTPTLGLANCPANIQYISLGKLSERKIGPFETKGFISKNHKVKINNDFDFRIGFDCVPTFQDDDFWNKPEKYIDIAYCSGGSSMKVEGDYYELNIQNKKSKWFMI